MAKSRSESSLFSPLRGARPARQGLAGGGVMKLTHGFAEGKREQCLARAEISM